MMKTKKTVYLLLYFPTEFIHIQKMKCVKFLSHTFFFFIWDVACAQRQQLLKFCLIVMRTGGLPE